MRPLLMLVSLAVAAVVADGATAAPNLMQNPGFESHLGGHWEFSGFHVTVDNDHHEGRRSLKCTQR